MGDVLLLSGGMDSAVCLFINKPTVCVAVDYGQPHGIELSFAERLSANQGVEFMRVEAPKLQKANSVVFAGRNALLLSIGASIAQSRNLTSVTIGCNKSDADAFPDCRPEFIEQLSAAFSAYGVTVQAPLLHMTKRQVATMAAEFGLGETDTWTCYSPICSQPCGKCYACLVKEAASV